MVEGPPDEEDSDIEMMWTLYWLCFLAEALLRRPSREGTDRGGGRGPRGLVNTKTPKQMLLQGSFGQSSWLESFLSGSSCLVII
jgi:hypothetical protein